MPQHPGIYVEEVRARARPIEPVGTSTAGFVGPTPKGPVTPRLVTSLEEYVSWYGGYLDTSDRNVACKYLPYAVRGFFENGGKLLFIARVVGKGAKTAALELPGECERSLVEAIGPGAWGNNISIQIRPASLAKEGTRTQAWIRLTLDRRAKGSRKTDDAKRAGRGSEQRSEADGIEDYDNLSITPGESNFGQSLVNGASKLVRLNLNGRPNDTRRRMYLRGGSDGEGEPTEEQFRGSAADPIYRRTGLVRLAENPEISLLAIPDDVHLPNLRNDALQQCEFLRDRFAVLSAPQRIDQEGANSELPHDSANGAYYLPWIKVAAPHTPEGHVLVPATGHIGGIYARVDAEHGVNRAPAGESVLGTVAPAGTLHPVEYAIDRPQQQELISRGINVIRYSSDEGVQVYGARTMSSDSDWKYVNVRRLYIFLKQSLYRGTLWVVFEPNCEQTWAALRRSVTDFLQTVWRKGALAGARQEEAFFIKCDESTMTQDDLEGGRLVCLVGVAPVRPAEFLILSITHHLRKEDDGFSSFNFLVEIGDIRAGFSEVDGLDAEDYSPLQVDADEHASRRKLIGLRKYTNLAMKRGVMGSSNLWAMNQSVNDRSIASSGTITLRNAPQKIVWRFSRAWPEACLDPELTANSNEVRELKLLVEGLEVDDRRST